MAVNGLTSTFPALSHPLYRRLLMAQLLFETGLTVFEVALFWTAARSVGAHAFVGALFALIVLPASVLAVPSGLAADRTGPRALVVGGGLLAAVAALGAAGLTAAGRVGAATAVLLAVAAGVALGAWSVPSQVIAGRSVPAAVLPEAVALSLIPSGAGAVAGGALSGVLLGLTGAPTTFLAAGALLVLAGGVAYGLRTSPTGVPAPVVADTAGAAGVAGPAGVPAPVVAGTAGAAGAAGLGATLRRVATTPLLWGLIGLAVTMSLFVVGRVAIFPAIVEDVLHGGPDQLGLLIGAGGLGILAGALVADPAGRRLGRGRLLVGAVVVAAAGFAGLGLSPDPLVSVALAGLTAGAMVVWQVTSSATVQLIAAHGERGRLLGVYDLFRLALIPLGSTGLGALADTIGVTATCLLAGGTTVLAAALTAAVNPALRRLGATVTP